MGRCIGFLTGEGRDASQAGGICSSTWDDAKKAEEAEKLQKIEELENQDGRMVPIGGSTSQPQAVTAGQLPEFEEVEIPEHLKYRGPFQGGRGHEEF